MEKKGKVFYHVYNIQKNKKISIFFNKVIFQEISQKLYWMSTQFLKKLLNQDDDDERLMQASSLSQQLANYIEELYTKNNKSQQSQFKKTSFNKKDQPETVTSALQLNKKSNLTLQKTFLRANQCFQVFYDQEVKSKNQRQDSTVVVRFCGLADPKLNLLQTYQVLNPFDSIIYVKNCIQMDKQEEQCLRKNRIQMDQEEEQCLREILNLVNKLLQQNSFVKDQKTNHKEFISLFSEQQIKKFSQQVRHSNYLQVKMFNISLELLYFLRKSYNHYWRQKYLRGENIKTIIIGFIRIIIQSFEKFYFEQYLNKKIDFMSNELNENLNIKPTDKTEENSSKNQNHHIIPNLKKDSHQNSGQNSKNQSNHCSKDHSDNYSNMTSDNKLKNTKKSPNKSEKQNSTIKVTNNTTNKNSDDNNKCEIYMSWCVGVIYLLQFEQNSSHNFDQKQTEDFSHKEYMCNEKQTQDFLLYKLYKKYGIKKDWVIRYENNLLESNKNTNQDNYNKKRFLQKYEKKINTFLIESKVMLKNITEFFQPYNILSSNFSYKINTKLIIDFMIQNIKNYEYQPQNIKDLNYVIKSTPFQKLFFNSQQKAKQFSSSLKKIVLDTAAIAYLRDKHSQQSNQSKQPKHFQICSSQYGLTNLEAINNQIIFFYQLRDPSVYFNNKIENFFSKTIHILTAYYFFFDTFNSKILKTKKYLLPVSQKFLICYTYNNQLQLELDKLQVWKLFLGLQRNPLSMEMSIAKMVQSTQDKVLKLLKEIVSQKLQQLERRYDKFSDKQTPIYLAPFVGLIFVGMKIFNRKGYNKIVEEDQSMEKKVDEKNNQIDGKAKKYLKKTMRRLHQKLKNGFEFKKKDLQQLNDNQNVQNYLNKMVEILANPQNEWFRKSLLQNEVKKINQSIIYPQKKIPNQ